MVRALAVGQSYRGVHGPLRDSEMPEMLILCFMDLQNYIIRYRAIFVRSISNRAVMNFKL